MTPELTEKTWQEIEDIKNRFINGEATTIEDTHILSVRLCELSQLIFEENAKLKVCQFWQSYHTKQPHTPPDYDGCALFRILVTCKGKQGEYCRKMAWDLMDKSGWADQ